MNNEDSPYENQDAMRKAVRERQSNPNGRYCPPSVFLTQYDIDMEKAKGNPEWRNMTAESDPFLRASGILAWQLEHMWEPRRHENNNEI